MPYYDRYLQGFHDGQYDCSQHDAFFLDDPSAALPTYAYNDGYNQATMYCGHEVSGSQLVTYYAPSPPVTQSEDKQQPQQ